MLVEVALHMENSADINAQLLEETREKLLEVERDLKLISLELEKKELTIQSLTRDLTRQKAPRRDPRQREFPAGFFRR